METYRENHGHGLVPSSRVRLAPERMRLSPPGHDPQEPQIVLIRQGDTICAIEVTCTCGKKVRMNCTF